MLCGEKVCSRCHGVADDARIICFVVKRYAPSHGVADDARIICFVVK